MRQHLLIQGLLLAYIVIAPSATTAAEMSETVNLLLRVCVAGGTSEQVDAQATGEVALTLKALKAGNIGGSGGVATKYSKSDWVGLQGGINSKMSELQAEQADKARNCLAPYMPGIVQAILQSQ